MFSYFYAKYIVDNIQYETPIYAYNENDAAYCIKDHFSAVEIISIKNYYRPNCFVVGEPCVDKDMYGYDLRLHFLQGGVLGINIENNIFHWQLHLSNDDTKISFLTFPTNTNISIELSEKHSKQFVECLVLESIKIFENSQKNA